MILDPLPPDTPMVLNMESSTSEILFVPPMVTEESPRVRTQPFEGKERTLPIANQTPVRVLVVGQTPPPYHGQAIITQYLVNGNYTCVSLHHVRLAFSGTLAEVGKFRLAKIFHLLLTIFRVWKARLVHRTPVLYYMPAGPDVVPIARDIIFLLATRWCFQRTVFHFHAAGVSERYERLPKVFRFLFRQAYFQPDLAIQLSEYNPPDGQVLRAKKTVVIGNGIEDQSQDRINKPRASDGAPAILFMGALRETKGVLVLLQACERLLQAQVPFRLQLMGPFESDKFRADVEAFLANSDLKEHVEFLGLLKDGRKWDAVSKADLLCLPSHYECEALPNVLVEAMMFQLPVVATRWRGIPSIVLEGETGYLVPIKDPEALAERLTQLLVNPELRQSMGERGRQRYLEEFTLDRFYQNMENTLFSVGQDYSPRV